MRVRLFVLVFITSLNANGVTLGSVTRSDYIKWGSRVVASENIDNLSKHYKNIL
jgi:hypothetical protein